MVLRMFVISKPKNKMFLLVIGNLILLIAIFIYLCNLQDNLRNSQWSGERCMSELKSLKYQLHVVTEYKNRIDNLLSDSQKAHQSDKVILKDIMESCTAMKQQTIMCQNQFEDIQSECKKVREDYNKLITQIEKTRTTT